ncbi:MAG: zinc-binding dehydrogenase [Firmicutes bacterium]|nr:zinc-binding dehydrogenase [Bacillota bacterium]
MQALVKTQEGPGFVELRDVPIPVPGSDEVLIRVGAAGICGTDVAIYRGAEGQVFYPPVVLGHEFSGEIAGVGAQVKDWKVGDRVVAEPQSRACGICSYCRTGRIGMCPEKRSPGWGTDGGMAEYVVMAAHLLHRIPENVSLDQAALAEPLSIAVHSMTENTSVEPGDFVLVFGPGPIGILSALAARQLGARSVLAAGTAKDEAVRLKAAEAAGIDQVVNVEKEDIVQKVLDLTGGVGADMVVEASGSVGAISAGVRSLRRQGRFVATGFAHARKLDFDWNTCVLKNLSMFFQYSSTYTSWDRSLKMLAGGGSGFDRVITRKAKLADWKQAFEDLENSRAVKILLEP